MNNRFELRGQLVSYGTSKNRDWMDVSTPDGDITVYLEGERLSYFESNYDLQNAWVIVTGYLTSIKYNDEIIAVATNVEVK